MQWDEISRQLGNVAAAASLLANVHPDEAMRTSCEQAEAEVDRFATELGQDRGLHDLFAGLTADGLDPVATRLLDRTLEDFRRAGVDLDDETRARLLWINERLTELGQVFSRTIRDDVRTVLVAAERLDGMPTDWLEAHPADADGLVAVTTDYPDALPARMFVRDAAVRREVTAAFLNRGWPANEAVLQEMFALRHELATLVGYADWASYDADLKMIKQGPAIPAFIDRIAEAAESPMRRDVDVLLERFRRDVPGADAIDVADSLHYEELVRREQHDVDAHQVRTYFDFVQVRQGLLDVTGRLFSLRYEQVADAPVWHEEVTVHDVFSTTDGARLGRIYLDLHPRPGKYKHAAQFTLADGLAGRQLAEGVLVCNFSRGLMEHDHVVTLFHEFGHLVHHVLGGGASGPASPGWRPSGTSWRRPARCSRSGPGTPRSSVLRPERVGEPIPAGLVARMRAADDFGKGYQARQQMFYAAMSYWFHTDRPADLTAAMADLQRRYAPFQPVADTHMFASFGHLGGYTSAYYTYMWSLVIAKDLFSAFDPADLFDPVVAGRYRDRVLAPGGSRDAADLVADFLGRPYTFDSYAAWLAR